MKTLNQIHEQYGESTMIAFESYVDAVLIDKDSRKSEYDKLADTLKNYAEVKEVIQHAMEYAVKLIKENVEYDIDQQMKKQAVGHVSVNYLITSRVLDAAAESIGRVYNDHVKVDDKWLKNIGGYYAKTSKELYGLISPFVQTEGDREILRNATYSDGFKCFSIK